MLRWNLLFFLSLILVSSCTIQKRLYNKGYSIEWKKKFHSTPNKKLNIALQEDEQVISSTDTLSSAEQLRDPILDQAIEEHLENDSTNVVQQVRNYKRISSIKHIQTNKKLTTNRKKILTKKEPKPPNENTRKEAVQDLQFGFLMIEFSAVCLAATLLFGLLLNVVTVIFFEYVLIVLLIIGITSLATCLGYAIGYFILGLIEMLIYLIEKLIYKHKVRHNEEYPDESESWMFDQ